MSQTYTDDCYASSHQAQVDLQSYENNFAALKSTFSGVSAPANLVAGMIWADTSGSDVVLKVRNKLNNAWGTTGFPSGTMMVFCAAAAPSGWTQHTAQNDKTLRVVGGASGGMTGGSRGLSSATVGDHVLTAAEMSAHAHSAVNYLAEKFAIPGAGEGAVDIFSQEPDGTPYTIYTDVQGSNYGHNHPLALAYVDVILAIKD